MRFTKMRWHNTLRMILASLMIGGTLGAFAVTDDEMNEAKAIAAKYYIRYINDGSGYLDNWKPKSMAELEKKLTNRTDKENFKKFSSAPTPTDYASWDKAQLVEYWSSSFFNENKGQLDEKGAANGMCKKQIKAAIAAMTIAPPAPAALPEEAAEPEIVENPSPEQTETAIQEELGRVEEEIAEADSLVESEDAAEPVIKEQKSSTWVYIMILAILIAIVIFLVVYASKTMKGEPKPQNKKRERYEEEEEEVVIVEEPKTPVKKIVKPEPEVPTPNPTIVNDSRIREKYAENLAQKAEEIRALTRQLSEMETLAAGLKEENRRLKAEVDQLRRAAAEAETVAAPSPTHHAPRTHSTRHEEVKEVYLGRVNSKGIFVRADRHAVDGQSIFKLSTTNGQSGTFTLINNPLIEEQVLDNPGKWLAGGCFAKDIFDTEGREGVRTETPGTAVFQDGAWRVEKKAKISYF